MKCPRCQQENPPGASDTGLGQAVCGRGAADSENTIRIRIGLDREHWPQFPPVQGQRREDRSTARSGFKWNLHAAIIRWREIAMTTGQTPALMKQINEAFNTRDVHRIMSFFAEDCTFLMARGPEPEGRRVHGKAAVRKVLDDRFRVINDMRWDHVDSFITGNRAVTVWVVTGTGIDGEKLNYRGCDLYEFRGEKILNKDTYWELVEHRDRL